MKTFACVLLLVAAVVAEPPRYRFARFRPERQELSDNPEEAPKAEEAPYAAAGYRPSQEFKLPSRQEAAPPSTSYGTPDDSYGAPLKTYSAPQTEYGSPEIKEGGEERSEDNENEEQGEKREKGERREEGEKREKEEGENEEEGKENKGKLEEEPKEDTEVVTAQGAYYVLLPGSQLQRVQFRTQNDLRNMAYTARLQYRDEDRAPLFVYTAVPQIPSSAYVQLI